MNIVKEVVADEKYDVLELEENGQVYYSLHIYCRPIQLEKLRENSGRLLTCHRDAETILTLADFEEEKIIKPKRNYEIVMLNIAILIILGILVVFGLVKMLDYLFPFCLRY